ncbi:MAG: Diacylglycerol kinase [Frankiales bacterium]|nr:Diacylglycerol kinase [Frankiales bacterium]
MLATEAPTQLVTTATHEELDAALLGADGRQVVVAGGDGSLHLAVARLRALGRLDLPLALVPLGTGNDLARALGLPLDPEEAAHVATAFAPKPLDLLVDDDGGVVVNAVHVGVGAEAAAAAGRWKPRLGPLAYPLGAVAAGLRSTGWRLRVVVDGKVVADGHRRALMVAIGNGRGIGGGTTVMPTASPDDGLLDVLVSYATGPFARVRYGAALTAGTHLRDPDVRWTRGRRVTVSGEPVGVNADGELGEEATTRTWTVEPGAWSLVRP